MASSLSLPPGELYPHPPPLAADYPPPFGGGGGPGLPGDLRSRMLDFGGGGGGRLSPVFQGGPPPRVPNEFGYQHDWNPEYQHCGGYYQGEKSALRLLFVDMIL